MQLTLDLNITPLPQPIQYGNTIWLSGSCFTEHMSDRLQQHRFQVITNPHGILFNPLSVATSLTRCLSGTPYTEQNLFYLNELWNSWQHHTRFSHTQQGEALRGMNEALAASHHALHQADWVILTLGSAFQYYLKETREPVANNHRAPAQWFDKRLLSVAEIMETLRDALVALHQINPYARVILTISPVRHVREGIIENNRSKARLIECVHEIVSELKYCYYFPAYELVIDVLRDYRYYDIDFAHPNFLATSYVWEQFKASCINPKDYPLMATIQDITIAAKHRPRFPDTQAHQQFKKAYLDKCDRVSAQHPAIDMSDLRQTFADGAS
jgi:hypothetical protein